MKTERTLPDSLARWTRARRLLRALRGRQTALDTRRDPWSEVLLQENQAIPRFSGHSGSRQTDPRQAVVPTVEFGRPTAVIITSP